MKIVKTKFRSRLTDKYLRDQLRLAVIAALGFAAFMYTFPPFYATLVLIACSQLEKLRNTLLNIKQKCTLINDKVADETKQQFQTSEEMFSHMKKQLNKCIRLHQDIISELTDQDEEAKQNYQVEISNSFATLESSDDVEKELDVNSVWENIRDSIRIAAEQSIGYYETKKKKPWFDEDCCMVVERRKQAKLKFLQDPVEEKRDNYFNERREASRTLRNKKRD
ncbi:hypothetical protein ANN_17287 [Periplaneta americana]|uniref:Uncharacterized protein n=1 Tax=Periplaneta americana TaxID=6978 RepID=A0ABQ8STX8_PERAM|nr:hypothetical protein ANN_17287 [Periplaneta americana]